MSASSPGLPSTTHLPGTMEASETRGQSQVTPDTPGRLPSSPGLGQIPPEHRIQTERQQSEQNISQQDLPPTDWNSWQIDNRSPSLRCPFGLDDGHAGGSCVDCDDPLGENSSSGFLCAKCLATAHQGLGQLDWQCESCGSLFTSATGQTEYCKTCIRRQF